VSSDALNAPIGHPLAAGDHVDQQTEEGEQDEHDDPARLAPAAQRIVTEEIDDHAEEHHQYAHEDERDEDQPNRFPDRKRKHVGPFACALDVPGGGL
jgi:hypothetical protein